MEKIKVKQYRFRLDDEHLEKFNAILKENNLSDKNTTLNFLIDNYITNKEIKTNLDEIRNALIGATLSSRESQKKSTLILDMLNAFLLKNPSYDLKLSHEKKSLILKKSEENYQNQLAKYKTRKESKRNNRKNPI